MSKPSSPRLLYSRRNHRLAPVYVYHSQGVRIRPVLMMKYKRGIQLSVTFLVIIIITMTVFSMSLYLIRQFFLATQEVEKQITADIQREVERRLAESGERVAIPLNKRTIKPGTSHAFGLGILNTGETSPFYILNLEALFGVFF